MNKKIQKATKRINEIKKCLQGIGSMVPGSLSQQQRKDSQGKMYGSYWKLGYTHKMKSRSHYVPEELVKSIQEQNMEYKKFKNLIEEWIELALFIATEELDQAKKNIGN